MFCLITSYRILLPLTLKTFQRRNVFELHIQKFQCRRRIFKLFSQKLVLKIRKQKHWHWRAWMLFTRGVSEIAFCRYFLNTSYLLSWFVSFNIILNIENTYLIADFWHVIINVKFISYCIILYYLSFDLKSTQQNLVFFLYFVTAERYYKS